MNKTLLRLTALWAAILLGGCVSFRVAPPPLPENQVETMVLCKKIEQKETLFFPEEIQDEFLAGSSPAHCFVKLLNVSRSIRLRWKWYIPNGKLFRETDEVTVNGEEVYLEAVTAYDRIDPQSHETHAGVWSVVVFVDGRLAGRRTFRVIL